MARRHRPFLWPLGALLVATLVLTWPTVRYLGTHVVDRQDPLLNTWIMDWEAYQLLRDPLRLFDANIFFPYEKTLAFSETLLGITVLVLPLRWAGLSALGAYNVAFLLSFFFTSLGAYLTATGLTRSRRAGLLAAVAYAFHPYRFGHLSQVQLLATGWLPLTLFYLDRCLRERPPARRNALLWGLFFSLQALSSFYSALFTATACLAYALGRCALVRSLPSRRATAGLIGAATLAVLVVAPVAWPYVEVNRTLGAAWSLETNERFSASLQAYLYAPPATRLWGALTARFAYTYGPCCPPDTLFPGLTVLALSALALKGAEDRRRWLYALLLVVGFTFSLGPTLHLRAGEPTGVPLPYKWLFLHVPGFQALRAPVRWALLVTLGLSMLAAWGVARHPRRAWLALAAVLVEFAALPVRLVEAPRPTAVVAWLAQQPPTRIVELPLAAELPVEPTPPDQPRRAWEVSRLLEYQYFSIWHRHTTPDGYSGYIPPRHGEWAREMAAFPSPRSLATLDALGIEYVVVHEADLEERRRRDVLEGIRQTRRLRQVACFSRNGEGPAPPCPSPADRVYRLLPAAEQAALNWRLWATAPLAPSAPARLWLELRADGVVALPTDTRLEVELTWQGPAREEEVLRAQPPIVVQEVAIVPLDVRPPEEPGRYEVVARVRARNGRLPDPPTPERLVTSVEVAERAPPAPAPVPVALTGVQATAEDGQRFTVRVEWQALSPLERYYSLSVRLLSADGRVIAQQDGPPGGDVPTLGWQPGERYGAEWALQAPEGERPAQVEIIWYDPEGGPPALVRHRGAWQQAIRVRPRGW